MLHACTVFQSGGEKQKRETGPHEAVHYNLIIFLMLFYRIKKMNLQKYYLQDPS